MLQNHQTSLSVFNRIDPLMPWNMQHSSLYWAFLQKVSSSVKISLIASRLDTASMSYSYDSPYAYFYDSLYVLFLLHTQAVVTLYCFSELLRLLFTNYYPCSPCPNKRMLISQLLCKTKWSMRCRWKLVGLGSVDDSAGRYSAALPSFLLIQAKLHCPPCKLR